MVKERIAQKLIEFLGAAIPVPGAGAIALVVNAGIDVHKQNIEDEQIGRTISASPFSFADKEIAVENAVQEMIHRYKDQIHCLTNKGIATAVTCAVNRIAHGILQDEPTEAEKAIPFSTRMVNYLHRVKITQGTLHLFHQTLETEPALKCGRWTEDGLFRGTGIHSQVQYFYSDNKDVCQYKTYDFRDIDDDQQADREAKQQGFDIKSMQKPPTDRTLSRGSLFVQKGEARPNSPVKRAQPGVTKNKDEQPVVQKIEGVTTSNLAMR